MSGGTRLDRLLNLLDTGSTNATRKAAAQQIGEIQKYHPYDLQKLLLRVHPYLRNKSWETRIAASQAIAAIASNVPKWDPEYKENVELKSEEMLTNTGGLKFGDIDIFHVLKYGTELLASGGTEFEELDDEFLDPKERLIHQRNTLEQKMGIAAKMMNLGDIITEDDFRSTKIVKTEGKLMEENEAKKKAADIAAVLENAGPMSARELNRMKRKAKQIAKSKENERRLRGSSGLSESLEKTDKKKLKNVVTEQPQNNNKVVIEAVADTDALFDNENVWPFHIITALLLNELFDPTWEVRHSAALGLREILKLHGAGAGKTANVNKEEQKEQNKRWLEDCCIRLLCVIALDRFGDYVGDQVVVPVRETCAQALGTLATYMDKDSVLIAFSILLSLQQADKWEVRHGSLLGLEYLIAVRQDLVDFILPQALPSVIRALKDFDDDVRSVASETLLPVAKDVVRLGFDKMSEILSILWDILLELDDLTASTNSVMNLLAELYSIPATSDATNKMLKEKQQNSAIHPLTLLVPRLWPFLLHNIASVRLATLNTLLKLLTLNTNSPDRTSWIIPILPDALCYIFQTILLESKPEITQTALSVWREFLKYLNEIILNTIIINFLPSWLSLISTQPTHKLDSQLLTIPAFKTSTISNKKAEAAPVKQENKRKRGRPVKEEGTTRKKKKLNNKEIKEEPITTGDELLASSGNVQGAPGTQEVTMVNSVDNTSSFQMRENGCEALGLLLSYFTANNLQLASQLIIQYIASPSAHCRTIICLLFDIWSKSNQDSVQPQAINEIPGYFIEVLQQKIEENITYTEIQPLTEQMLSDYQILITSMINMGAPASAFENDYTKLDLKKALYTATTQFDEFIKQIITKIPQNIQLQLQARQQHLINSINNIQNTIQQLHITVQASISMVFISWNKLPKKLNTIIHSLMNAIKKELSASLQRRFALATAKLIQLVLTRSPCPNSKIIKNLCSFISIESKLTQDKLTQQINKKSVKELMEFYENELANEQQLQIQQNQLTAAENLIPLDHIQYRGAEFCLQSLATIFSQHLFAQLPLLWNILASPIDKYSVQQLAGLPFASSLLNALQLIMILLPKLHSELYPPIVQLLPKLFVILKNPVAEIRTSVAKTIAVICKIITLDSMKIIIYQLLPFLGCTEDELYRIGVAEALQYIINYLEIGVLPYLIFLVVPILGRMSDQSIYVRKLVTKSFATLVRLMPLESGIENPPGFTPEMIEQKLKERKFLEQLLDGSKLDEYKVPITVNAQLRKYQQDGLNWLAFLQKYKLHGILCDDMGLGKTLQTLCMIVSDNYNRKQVYEQTKNPESTPLPSLVVCPPTVVGHWFHEIKKFFSNYCNPIQYIGSPSERSALRQQIMNHDIIILSYDILRNDIDFLKEIYFNYCALDEGHIIRNSKTKITLAAKMIRANHRLILSGTPIQNNVLELWSLFDYLMPGFLGTEKQFNQVYGKPILAAKDPKCSAKEQEQGTLALEALHRQVLPFLLRRVKEDVLQDLPPKIIQDYYCELSTLQKQLYEDFATSSTCQDIQNTLHSPTAVPAEKEKKSSQRGGTHIFQALQYLRKLCNHPLLVLNEQHPEYTRVMKDIQASGDSLHSLQHAPKLLALKQLLQDCGIGVATNSNDQNTESSDVIGQHRVLIFAQLKLMLDIIENDLLKKHMPKATYLRLDGTVSSNKRHSIVTQFNEDPTIDILLLTTHVGGLGLNLTGADTVIFMEHDWNPMKDLQAMDRAHRLGQTKVVNVYRLITRGTLEEKIMGLQKFKLNIANSVVNQDNSSLRTMDTDQLLDLFDFQPESKSKSSNTMPGAGVMDEFGNVNTSKKKESVKQIVENLGELWDDSQYEEYNIDNFLTSLRPS